MATTTPVHQKVIAGAGGGLTIASLFLPWASVAGIDQSGWEFNTVLAVYLLFGALFALATAITGGLYGAGRPDVSVIGATDLLNTTSMILLVWLIFDFPDHAARGLGVFTALIAVAATAFAVADYRPLRGAPWFAPVDNAASTAARR